MSNNCCQITTIHFNEQKSPCDNKDNLTFEFSNPQFFKLGRTGRNEPLNIPNAGGLSPISDERSYPDVSQPVDASELNTINPLTGRTYALTFDYVGSECCEDTENTDGRIKILARKVGENNQLPVESDFNNDSVLTINPYTITVYSEAKISNGKILALIKFQRSNGANSNCGAFNMNLEFFAIDNCYNNQISKISESDGNLSLNKKCGDILAALDNIPMDNQIWATSQSYKLNNAEGIRHIIVVEYDLLALPDSIGLISEKWVSDSQPTQGGSPCNSNNVDSPIVDLNNFSQNALTRIGRVPSNLPSDGMSEELSGKGMLYYLWDIDSEDETSIRPYIRGWGDYATKLNTNNPSTCVPNKTQYNVVVHCPIKEEDLPNGVPELRLIDVFPNYTSGFGGGIKVRITGGEPPYHIKFRKVSQSSPYNSPMDCSTTYVNHPAGGDYDFYGNGRFLYETVIDASDLDSNNEIFLPRPNETKSDQSMIGVGNPGCLDIDLLNYDYDEEFLLIGQTTTCHGFSVLLWDSSNSIIDNLPEAYNIGNEVLSIPTSPSNMPPRIPSKNRLFDTIPFVYIPNLVPTMNITSCAQDGQNISFTLKNIPIGTENARIRIGVYDINDRTIEYLTRTDLPNDKDNTGKACDISTPSGDAFRESSPTIITGGSSSSDLLVNNLSSVLSPLINVTGVKTPSPGNPDKSVDYEITLENVPECICAIYRLQFKGNYTDTESNEVQNIDIAGFANRPCNKEHFTTSLLESPRL